MVRQYLDNFSPGILSGDHQGVFLENRYLARRLQGRPRACSWPRYLGLALGVRSFFKQTLHGLDSPVSSRPDERRPSCYVTPCFEVASVLQEHLDDVHMVVPGRPHEWSGSSRTSDVDDAFLARRGFYPTPPFGPAAPSTVAFGLFDQLLHFPHVPAVHRVEDVVLPLLRRMLRVPCDPLWTRSCAARGRTLSHRHRHRHLNRSSTRSRLPSVDPVVSLPAPLDPVAAQPPPLAEPPLHRTAEKPSPADSWHREPRQCDPPDRRGQPGAVADFRRQGNDPTRSDGRWTKGRP
eukprot:scaffold287_cov337-Pavlova_lutheri.AAC.56